MWMSEQNRRKQRISPTYIITAYYPVLHLTARPLLFAHTARSSRQMSEIGIVLREAAIRLKRSTSDFLQ